MDSPRVAAELLASAKGSGDDRALAAGRAGDPGERAGFGADGAARRRVAAGLARRTELARVRVGRAPALGISNQAQAAQADAARVGHPPLRWARLLRLGRD